ncbi:MAG: phospho-N-acetylmuramoyl-pentapeptide-transferase [Nitrospirae bacterium RIFCSPLOWO2_02_FULL_62_14]|nr:MAG: phospho-N-acetylmuramoyl-pentapeptide-transferase [Nitrospirae bacterium RIFCSPLOWO2_02_FULL_62_14]OGW69790.1 MAG: phospho-N-acetylmuramoyl-pentapeptide-transferase [Nitrospirae bacterium RIFCSPLOWO2_01_FULL_62_17]OGW88953.1 MAG: phospho-N-acetylmuramoyl-pentapeptide-transferase [Nitrospirae bacterium RIFCSPLOWO2_12_FULL_63_8]
MLYLLLYPLHTEFAALNVFRYLSFRLIYAAITAFLIAFVLAPPLIRRLQAIKMGQHIREDGPSSHLSKEGTPTMGGILILFAVVLSTVLWADITNQYVWLALGAMLGYGVIGFLDDYRKFTGSKSKGLTAWQKIVAQGLLALAIGLFFYSLPGFSTKLSVPFFKNFMPDLGLLYIPFAVLVIVGSSNAVNLTDGLDGLAVGPIMIASLAYTIVAYVVGNKIVSDYLLIPHIEGAGELAVFTAAIFGASLGFLWFNTYPASVFMGDVGSLPLGAALGTVAVVSKHELLLLLVGGVFVIEAISVIFQVASFKSRGKRIFLMAPIHHHFEMKGWEEPKVVVRLWIIAILLALLSLSTLKLR